MSDLLQELLGPITVDAFFRRHWERAPYVVATRPSSWSSLMSLARFETLVNAGGLVRPFVVGAKTEAVTSTTAFAERAPLDIAETHLDGWTLALQAVNRIDPALGLACTMLGERLGALVMANVYLTPPSSRGYPPHYDTHDNFLVQISGSKRWSVWGSPRHLPTWSHLEKRMEVGEYAENEAPQISVLLRPGDVLYLPRGFVHAASAEKERSLHLTLNVSVVRFADLLKRRLEPWMAAERSLESTRESIRSDRAVEMAARLREAMARMEE